MVKLAQNVEKIRFAGIVHLCLQNEFNKNEKFLGETTISVDMLGQGKTDIYLAFDYDYQAEDTTIQVVPADFEDIVYLPTLLFISNGKGAWRFNINELTKTRVINGENRHIFYPLRASCRGAVSEVFFGKLSEGDLSTVVDALLLYQFGFSNNEIGLAYAENIELDLKKPIKVADLNKIKYIIYREVFMIGDEKNCPLVDSDADLDNLINALNENGGSDRLDAYRFAIVNKQI